MTISKTIAGLISPTLVAIAAGMLLNMARSLRWRNRFPAPPRSSSCPVSSFIAGLAIVRVHNRWANGWPVLVTILGWLFVLGLGAFLSFKAYRRN
jgi:hypothetical protein